MELKDCYKNVLFVILVMVFSICVTSCSSERSNNQVGKASLSDYADQKAKTRHVFDYELARTPPMGWNSWNCFHKDINEEQIKRIADAMVDSGMRDAGYEYLVLDDAWMAPERDSNGNLVGDPDKFPSGMKALGDYIHSKGLKYGIYECRAVMTCQSLPGLLGHEQQDIDTFASWGVDYMKIDSCHAIKNGRLSNEDYALLRECVINSGRPMVLSISDFGNGAWAWRGDEVAHLWRTSGDIRANMRSVYNCAETTAGDRRIHPAFNGLWMFAGPGHWNDPDMMQVGNLPDPIEDRAHFSLWCIFAAPLMAGNDLRNMSDTVRDILTAPEVIAINQDPRGIQGYKIYNKDDIEIYNKPLSDGTTAVLLLNKGTDTTDITVTWGKIGLSGKQKVRDLWARKNLGSFKNSFTASDLPQHGHMLIKVGKPGSKLVPIAEPLPLEKYMVTKGGDTYLSDLCYIWINGNAPQSDKNTRGDAIKINGTTYRKGLGVGAGCSISYKVSYAADRFKAVVGMDDSYAGTDTGRFRVRNEDRFANDILFDSGIMAKGDPPKEIDIDIRHVDCLNLIFESSRGRRVRSDVLGNWANARVTSRAFGKTIDQ